MPPLSTFFAEADVPQRDRDAQSFSRDNDADIDLERQA